MSRYAKGSVALTISLICLALVSLASWIAEVDFLSEYSLSLLATSGLVKREAMLWYALSLAEVVIFSVAIILLARQLLRVAKLHASPDFYEKHKIFTLIYAFSSVLTAVFRYISLILRYFAKNVTVNIESDGMVTSGVVTEPLLPWFSIVATIALLAYIFYTYYFLSSLKDDIKNNYQ